MSLMFLVIGSAFLPHEFPAVLNCQSRNESQTRADISCAAEGIKTPTYTSTRAHRYTPQSLTWEMNEYGQRELSVLKDNTRGFL